MLKFVTKIVSFFKKLRKKKIVPPIGRCKSVPSLVAPKLFSKQLSLPNIKLQQKELQMEQTLKTDSFQSSFFSCFSKRK